MIAWLVVITAISFIIRAADPSLAASVGSLIAGYVAAMIAGRGSNAPLIAGAVLLLWWGIYHVTMIWNQFPVWYHLTFFVSLPLLSYVGGRLRR